ncbi:MAG TPA: hypothetical protein EYP60_01985 [bacterium (Candidatus Stahlbacteria)]|nr:hypothetical protein [Candidatus Stahlbacteria bacterium]
MNIIKKFMQMDRRYVFALVGICVLIPLLLPIGLPTWVTKPTRDFFNAIDNIPPNQKPILLSFDFTASTMPENMPMAEAVLRHCFGKGIRVLLMTHYPAGTGMIEIALDKVLKEYEKKYGEDYVFLGYMPGGSAVMLSLGESIRRTFPKDYYGNKVDTLPMMADVHNYDDIPLVVSISGSALPLYWIIYAGTTYRQKVACGVTAVSAPEFYPYLETGQFEGMLGGLKGASEYENLVERYNYSNPDVRKTASIGMDEQSLAHLVYLEVEVRPIWCMA